jgi:O-antigen/teichoic acid export membrane protein
MSQLKLNLAANFLGRGWYALMSLLFVPLYIRFMGMEAYGLVGLFVSLQALFAMFDFGLGATFTREIARYSARGDRHQEALDLARTLEVLYWAIGIAIGCLILALSGLIARYWVRAERLDAVSISHAVVLMGLVFMLQWPTNLYAGGLRGLQRQVLLNIINASLATMRGIGAVLILWLISPSIHAFLAWQVCVSLLQTLATGFGLWLNLPKTGQRPGIRIELLKTVWPLAARLSALSVVILLLSQLDKVILSKVVSLTAFGYYALASQVASTMSVPMAPVSEALFPKMSQLAAQRSTVELGRLYHRGAQSSALALFPVAGLLLVFPKEVLFLWTGDSVLVANAWLLVAILSFGVVLNCSVMGMLDLLQMSCGWLKPALCSRVLAFVLLGPAMVGMASTYGAIGAALTWLMIYCCYLLVTPHFAFKRLLPTEKWHWYSNDFALPLAAAVGMTGIGRVVLVTPVDRVGLLLYLVFIFGMAFLAVAFSMRYTRQLIGGAALRFARGVTAARI